MRLTPSEFECAPRRPPIVENFYVPAWVGVQNARLDVFHEKWALVWLQWSADGLESVGNFWIGRRPRWFDDAWDAEGESGFYAACLDFADWSDDDGASWGLREGIAPRQPFLAKLRCPRGYSYWTDCGKEYDVEYFGEIVLVEKWPPSRVARAWKPYAEFLLGGRK